ncbi:ion transporter [Nannocystis sp. RBIL2]|uniref:ion transporter n=1 Tax=Nannocystis sp. RBIL2 TaxID=2996788 RepID=UPI00226F19AF|nr:ion transporter [Nannocystis sp. RBIL2]MCY1065263.1 ion transporter [Nannocystis sp. RBIL2]
MAFGEGATDGPGEPQDALSSERSGALHRLESWLEGPMVVLGLIWLALLVVEFIWGLPRFLELTSTAIWIVFIVDFAVRFALAPAKLAYLRRNWLTALSLTLPALRLLRIFRAFRVFQVARAARGVRLVRVISSVNRGMGALGKSMSRRGLGYVVSLTFVVLLAGSAGMYAFEYDPEGNGLDSYGDALWWTAMLMTTIASEYWPRTPEGRLLCLLLSAFSIGIIGYLTASLATFFVGRDAESAESEIAGERALRALQLEIAALREELGGRSSPQPADSPRKSDEASGGGTSPGSRLRPATSTD